MEEKKISTEYITLGQFLKFANIIETGGREKEFLKTNVVLVNSIEENRRGRKLYRGDVVEVNNKSFKNNGYTEFYKYKRDKDLYVFYVYQGFYKANCTLGENISLFDYITGDVSYSGSCNGNHSFNGVIDNYDKLQLYKYELKKNSNGDFYLYGYNPVNDVSIG